MNVSILGGSDCRVFWGIRFRLCQAIAPVSPKFCEKDVRFRPEAQPRRSVPVCHHALAERTHRIRTTEDVGHLEEQIARQPRIFGAESPCKLRQQFRGSGDRTTCQPNQVETSRKLALRRLDGRHGEAFGNYGCAPYLNL